jgi:hypothetical protein
MGQTTMKCKIEQKRKINHKAVSGYHVLNEDFNDTKKVFRVSLKSIAPYVSEGYLVNTTEHLPGYKTFFVGLSAQESMRCFQESLLNISSIEEQEGKKWKLEGTSLTPPIAITCIVRMDNLELVTFFPTSDKSSSAQMEFIQKERSVYVRYYFNPCYPVLPAPDCTDSNTLQARFGIDGMDVQLQFVHVDVRSVDLVCLLLQLKNVREIQQPVMRYGLLPREVVDALANADDLAGFRQQLLDTREMRVKFHELLNNPEYTLNSDEVTYVRTLLSDCDYAQFIPDRKVTILNSMNKVYLPDETLQKVFSDGHKRFPDCLTKIQVIDKLKEAINNFIQLMKEDFGESVWEDIDLSKWRERTRQELHDNPSCPRWLPVDRDSTKTGGDWDYFGGRVFPPSDPSAMLPVVNKYALEMMHCDLLSGRFNRLAGQDIPTNLPIPTIGIHTAEDKVARLHLYSSGTCFMDTWEVNIQLDPYSGNIVDFYFPLKTRYSFTFPSLEELSR